MPRALCPLRRANALLDATQLLVVGSRPCGVVRLERAIELCHEILLGAAFSWVQPAGGVGDGRDYGGWSDPTGPIACMVR